MFVFNKDVLKNIEKPSKGLSNNIQRHLKAPLKRILQAKEKYYTILMISLRLFSATQPPMRAPNRAQESLKRVRKRNKKNPKRKSKSMAVS